MAQSQTSAAPAASQDAIGEVVVTARKQSERLQDVPIDITALTSASLATLGVKNLFDLMQVTPSLSYGNTGSRTGNKLTLRGLGVSTTGASKASVFLDGVYVAGDFTGLSFAGLDRVEVLKGPQSALFGRSSFAGAINYVTRQPSNNTEGSLSVDAATLGEVHVDGAVSGPLVEDKLFGFLSASYYKFDGPDAWKDTIDGSRHGSQTSGGFMGKLTYRVNENLTIRGLASYNKDDDGPASALFLNPSARNGAIAKINPLTGVATGAYAYYPEGTIPTFKPKSGDYSYYQGYLTDPGDVISQWRSYLQLEYDFLGGHTLTITGAHNDQTTDDQSNAYLRNRPPASIGGYVYNSISDTDLVDNSVELRIASPQKQKFRYAIGLYYLDIEQHNKPSTTYYVAPTAAGDLISIGSYGRNGNTDYSVFGALYYDPIDPLTISFEARYQGETVKRTGANAGAVLLSAYDAGVRPTMTPILAPDGTQFNTTFTAFLPRVNVQYRFSPDLNVYFTYSVGDNPGGFNTSLYASDSQRYIKEESLYNYEVGLKANIMKQLSLTLAAYHMDWDNQQTTGTYYNGAIIYSIVENQGRSRINGGEAELDWKTPIPGLDARGAVSYNDGKYIDFCSANYAALTYTLPATATAAQKLQYSCRSVNGNSLESIPDWQASAELSYTRRLWNDWDGYIRGDYEYTGAMWDSELNLAQTDPANVVNLRLGVQNAAYSVEFYGKNLTDEDAPTRVTRASDPFAGATNATNQSIAFTPRTPRQFGVRVGLHF